MDPLTYSEWSAMEEGTEDPVRRRERYQAYVAGVIFIRSQIGGLPRTGRPAFSESGSPALAGR